MVEKIKVIKSTSIPIMRDNIDTDQLIPKQFLKNILKTGYGKIYFTIGAMKSPINPILTLFLTNRNAKGLKS